MVLKSLAVLAGLAVIGADAPSVTAQATGGIRGRLEIRKIDKPVERRPDVAAPGAAGPRDLPDLRRGVVYLETAPRSAFDERDPGHATMDQRNERFVPHVLAVMVGTVVDFPNSDFIYHNVFSLSRAKRFDLGRYAAGKSKAVRMDRPGVVRVFCDIHSHMNAFVLGLQSSVLRRHRCRRPLRAALAALRHVHDRRLVRGRSTRHALGGRPADRLGGSRPGRAVMRVLGSITNRIFLASALLAMLSIGAAVYFVSSRMTSETEAELQGDLTEAATLVDEQRVTQFDNVSLRARLIADLPKFKAVVEIGDRPTLMPIASEYQQQAGADLLMVTGRSGEQLALVGEIAATPPPSRPRSPTATATPAFWTHPAGVLEVVSVPITLGLDRPEILGTLSIGYLLDDRRAAQFKALTGADIAFAMGGVVRASTLGPGSAEALTPLLAGQGVKRIAIGSEEYVAISQPLGPNAVPPIRRRSSCGRAANACAR